MKRFEPEPPFFLLLSGLFLHVMWSRGLLSECIACSDFVLSVGSRHDLFLFSVGAAHTAAIKRAVSGLWAGLICGVGEGDLNLVVEKGEMFRNAKGEGFVNFSSLRP